MLDLESLKKELNPEQYRAVVTTDGAILIIAGAGSGKTRGYCKPNLMQMHSSYVVTDPKGTILVECGKMLQDNGYRIKVFETTKESVAIDMPEDLLKL